MATMNKVELKDIQTIARKLFHSGIDACSKNDIASYLDTTIRFLISMYPKEIGSIYKEKPKIVKPTEKCAICFDTVEEKEAKVTECNHVFHKNCLDKWIREFDAKTTSPTCPCCRKTITVPVNEEEEFRQACIYIERGRRMYNIRRVSRSIKWYELAVVTVRGLIHKTNDKNKVLFYIDSIMIWNRRIRNMRAELLNARQSIITQMSIPSFNITLH